MEHEPLTPQRAIAARVQELRKGRGWSQERLAQAMRDVGIPWERMVVTKLESGRRAGVSVDELLALAYVLDVAPVHLLVPTDNESPYRVAPDVSAVSASAARSWIRGYVPVGDVDPRRYASQVPAHEFACSRTRVSPAGGLAGLEAH